MCLVFVESIDIVHENEEPGISIRESFRKPATEFFKACLGLCPCRIASLAKSIINNTSISTDLLNPTRNIFDFSCQFCADDSGEYPKETSEHRCFVGESPWVEIHRGNITI